MVLIILRRCILALILFTTTLFDFTSAYRPTQFCKHRGENGKAEMCFAINSFYNTSTDASDVYITLKTWRFKDSAKGWAAMGLGKMMTGALMFIIYGDPAGGSLVTTIRTATGHHPPLSVFGTPNSPPDAEGVPELEVRSSKWEVYDGEYFNDNLKLKPTHVGTSEIVCYDCAKWSQYPIRPNSTTAQEMIWSTNSEQDFGGDFSDERSIDMHEFGRGFGFLWTDMVNAAVGTKEPFFPAVDEMRYDLGMNEYTEAEAPTEAELKEGEEIELAHSGIIDGGDTELEDIHAPQTTAFPSAIATDVSPPPTATPQSSPDDSPIYPAPTLLGKSIRDWLFTLHGLLMSLAFLALYPLGSYFIRSPRATAFNLHWTTQSLATVCVLLAAGIGWWQSHSISVTHQFLGFAVVAAILVQGGLGAWHHRAYVRSPVKRRTWMAKTHVYLGRSVVVAGLVNLVMGVLLAHHSRAVVLLTVVAGVLVVVAMTYVLGRDGVRRLAGVQGAVGSDGVRTRDPLGMEAEEYFQLAGDEDEDELDSDGEGEGQGERLQDRVERQMRLAKLDKV